MKEMTDTKLLWKTSLQILVRMYLAALCGISYWNNKVRTYMSFFHFLNTYSGDGVRVP